MTKLPEIISVVPSNETYVSIEAGCSYCGSSNCGAIFGDPVCNELPVPPTTDMVGME